MSVYKNSELFVMWFCFVEYCGFFDIINDIIFFNYLFDFEFIIFFFYMFGLLICLNLFLFLNMSLLVFYIKFFLVNMIFLIFKENINVELVIIIFVYYKIIFID